MRRRASRSSTSRRGRRSTCRGARPAWRETLDLAWAAYRSGTIPVGAVVLDGSGRVVARGRNRIFDGGGSRLLHAEVNALLELGTATYEDHVLLTSLEPCHLCTTRTAEAWAGSCR